METIIKTNSTIEKFITEFESSKKSLFGDLSIREKAFDVFLKQGIPSRKHEEYKYVNMELLMKGDFAFSTKKALTCEQISGTQILNDAIVVVLENGIFIDGLSKIKNLPKGLTIVDISEAKDKVAFKKHFSKYADINSDPLIALNAALAQGGVFIYVEKNAVIEKPIHVVNVATSTENLINISRNLFVVEENAQVKILESFETVDTSAKIITNSVTEIYIGKNAIVEHNKIQVECEFGNLVCTTQSYQESKSIFTTNTFILSGAFVRNNLNMVLDDEHIESHLNGLYLTKGNQIVDNHTLVDHRKPNCNSNELYKGIIDEKSVATFNGKIFVRKDAQKTNAFQSNKNILLSDDGTINTKPQLEIYADDVKCSHGTSTGKLDADKIFYLRARGLSELSAKKLLMHAFASEVVDMVTIEELKTYLEDKITKRFE